MKGFKLRLSAKAMSLSGLQALDWRRTRGLPDGTSLYSDTSTLYFPIEDEAFVRLWFAAQETCPSANISLDWLIRNELNMHTNSDCVGMIAELPEARVQNLFVHAKFEILLGDLKKAEQQLKAVQAMLDKEDETD